MEVLFKESQLTYLSNGGEILCEVIFHILLGRWTYDEQRAAGYRVAASSLGSLRDYAYCRQKVHLGSKLYTLGRVRRDTAACIPGFQICSVLPTTGPAAAFAIPPHHISFA